MGDVRVDGRALKTPQGRLFQTPTLALSKAIEAEWEEDPSPSFQQKPLTSLTATALDQVAISRDSFITYALHAISRDVLLFWAETPSSLVTLQEEKWAPLIKDVNRRLNLSLGPTLSFSPPPLLPTDEQRIREILEQATDFKLTGFCHLLTLTSSFCLSYLVLEDCLSAEEAWALAHLHEHTQRRLWGEDEETLLQEKTHYEEFLETVRFLRLIEAL